MADRDEFGAFLVGFLVGAVTGGVVALLFAPQSGEETRALIGERSIELRDKAVEGGKQAYSQAASMPRILLNQPRRLSAARNPPKPAKRNPSNAKTRV